eukprot:1972427-Rhodomonas_salina.2
MIQTPTGYPGTRLGQPERCLRRPTHLPESAYKPQHLPRHCQTSFVQRIRLLRESVHLAQLVHSRAGTCRYPGTRVPGSNPAHTLQVSAELLVKGIPRNSSLALPNRNQ